MADYKPPGKVYTEAFLENLLKGFKWLWLPAYAVYFAIVSLLGRGEKEKK